MLFGFTERAVGKPRDERWTLKAVGRVATYLAACCRIDASFQELSAKCGDRAMRGLAVGVRRGCEGLTMYRGCGCLRYAVGLGCQMNGDDG